MTKQKQLKSKVCLVGDKAVGKTSLIRRYTINMFEEEYLTTIGTHVTKKETRVLLPEYDLLVDIDMMIWDIMGEKGFRELLKDAYFYGANGILAVADLTRRRTLDNLDDWIDGVEDVAGKVPILIAINKSDLAVNARFREIDVAAFAKAYDDEDRRGPAVPGRAGPHASPRRGASRPFGRADRHHEPRCFTDGHVDDGLADQPDVTECRARRRPSGIAVADRNGWMVAKPISRERLAEHQRERRAQRHRAPQRFDEPHGQWRFRCSVKLDVLQRDLGADDRAVGFGRSRREIRLQCRCRLGLIRRPADEMDLRRSLDRVLPDFARISGQSPGCRIDENDVEYLVDGLMGQRRSFRHRKLVRMGPPGCLD